MANRTSRTPENEAAFLAELSQSGNVTKSCELAGVARSCAYDWRDADPEFKAAWDVALERGTDALEDEVMRRAKDGTDRPVFYQGEQCGAIREYSDTLAIVMLKARRRDKFGDRSEIAHSGSLTINTISYADG